MNLYFLLAKQYIVLYCHEVLVSIVSKFKQRNRRKEPGCEAPFLLHLYAGYVHVVTLPPRLCPPGWLWRGARR